MAQMQVLARRVLTFLRSFYSCSQKYKKVWHFLRKTLDICLRFGYNNTRRQGHGPRRKEYADVAELADALDSGSSSLKRVWVQILHPHQRASSFGLRLFFFVLAFKLFIALPKQRDDYRSGISEEKRPYEGLPQAVRRISICLRFPVALNLALNRVPNKAR